MAKKRKKVSLNDAAKALTQIAERHLSQFSEEEQDSRVAAFSRVIFRKKDRGSHSKSSETERTRVYRALARGRE